MNTADRDRKSCRFVNSDSIKIKETHTHRRPTRKAAYSKGLFIYLRLADNLIIVYRWRIFRTRTGRKKSAQGGIFSLSIVWGQWSNGKDNIKTSSMGVHLWGNRFWFGAKRQKLPTQTEIVREISYNFHGYTVPQKRRVIHIRVIRDPSVIHNRWSDLKNKSFWFWHTYSGHPAWLHFNFSY